MEKLAAVQQSNFEELDGLRVLGRTKSLTNALTTFNQYIHAFSECYNEEFKQWSDRTTVQMNNIGT